MTDAGLRKGYTTTALSLESLELGITGATNVQAHDFISHSPLDCPEGKDDLAQKSDPHKAVSLYATVFWGS
jgi:hypothetical protein